MEEIFIKERDRMLGRIVFGHGIGETVPVLEEYAGTASVLNVYVICDIRVSGYADMLESRASDSSRVKICGKYMLEASEEKKDGCLPEGLTETPSCLPWEGASPPTWQVSPHPYTSAV